MPNNLELIDLIKVVIKVVCNVPSVGGKVWEVCMYVYIIQIQCG